MVGVPATKMQQLATAKARNDMTTGSNASTHVISGETDQTTTITQDIIGALGVVHVQNNKSCHYIIPSDVTAVKVLFEGCTSCTLTLEGTISTGVVEVWKSDACEIIVKNDVGTMQVDMVNDLTLTYEKSEFLGSVVQAGALGLKVQFGDGRADMSIGLVELRATRPDEEINDTTDQYITRKIDGTFLTERIIRLANDFPTTAREKALFDAEATQKREALEKVAEGIIGVGGDAEEIRGMTSAASITENDDCSPTARSDFKKNQGNEAFKESNWPQAGVYYTEAILIQPSAVLHANRAACFLKLNQFEKALADADACIALDDASVKGHFRRGLALMAVDKFEEAGASFATTLKLDPNNTSAKSSIQIAQVKAARARASR
eukprot:TRINITY_DN6239_c0_g5_i1.p1 TRINITY_DN6239_c0_g5~~TRINITY_DN6239_c0_g5_i1.p1  ORF type:complete len:402 (+),score=127.16 TRINITY_DN6239_c0_g5_i1:72-1208(+)